MPYNVWQRNAVTEEGDVISLAEVEVFHAESVTKPSLYSDESGGVLTNPFNADASGFIKFYTLDGFYDIAINGVLLWRNIKIGSGEYDNVSQLAQAFGRIGDSVTTRGCNSVGDGGHGKFIMEAASGTPDGYSRVVSVNGLHWVLQPTNGKYNVYQFGLSGTSDDTLTLQRFVTACAGSVATLTKGTFIISQLTIPDNTALELAGSSKIVRKASTSIPLIVTGSNVKISGTGTIDGNKVANTGDLDNIYINNKTSIRISGISNINAVGSGALVNVNGVDRVSVRKCYMAGCNIGVRLFNARYCTVSNNEGDNVIGSWVTATGNSVRYGKSISVNHNKLKTCGSINFQCVIMSVWPGAVDDGSGLVFRATAPSVGDWYDHNQPYYSNVQVIGNEWAGCSAYGIITRAEYVTIKNNTINGCSYSGIVPQGRHLTITGNIANDCASVGIDLGNCAWVTCDNNTMRNCGDIGLELTCVNFGVIGRSTIENCGSASNAPMTIGNGNFYSLYGVAKSTIVSGANIHCNSTNMEGLNVNSVVNTLSGYVVEDIIVTPHSAPPVGFEPVRKSTGLNQFNIFFAGTTYSGRHFIGSNSEANSTLSVNPAVNNANGIRIDGGASGTGASIVSQGTDTDIDLVLSTKGTGSIVRTSKPFMFRPNTSASPVANGDVIFERTSNTTVSIKMRGTDGVVRTASLTLV